jgi:signal transduction histidine kinase
MFDSPHPARVVALPGTGTDADFARRAFGPASAARGLDFVAVEPDPRRVVARPRRGPPPGEGGFGPGPGGLPPSPDRMRERGPSGDRPPPPDAGRRRGGPRPPFPHFSPIVVNGEQIGSVAVPSGPPPMEVVLRELGPTLIWSGLGLLTLGSTVLALAIFGPARRRLRSLEEAARAVGEGRTDVRADERGGDEVSVFARTFNQMASELEVRAGALAASDRARRQLLADVSHELMTPLTAIRGYTQTLAMPELTVDKPTRARYLDIVDRETYKLEAIIGDLLDLAKLEGGGSTLAVENVAVAELFERIAERHDPALRARGIRLDVSVPDDLELEGDAQRLEQALQNVASNAIRHTPDGGVIELHAEDREPDVRITIRDTGPGIPPEHLSHIFDRFYKVDASRTANGGTPSSGLGLSIVRAIIGRHGGTVTAANAPDGGAIFEFRLPKTHPTHL